MALVTGCTSGIGEATARRFLGAGFAVYATGRGASRLEGLRAAGAVTDDLDVDREEDIERVVSRIEQERGRLDVLVNNAGWPQVGAIADLDRETLRRQFETNVFGPISLARRATPIMRRQGRGVIVNVSSVAGRISVPLLGAYCASKFALEAVSDAMRTEEARFGVRVVLVEPGPVRTRFNDRARESLAAVDTAGSVFGPVYGLAVDSYAGSRPTGASPDRVARTILRAARARRPRSRYRVRLRETLVVGILQAVPRGAMDWALRKWMDLDRLRTS